MYQSKKMWQTLTESRKFNENIEWMLDKEIFHYLIQKFGEPEIDLFASRSNRQLEMYISWKPDPDAFCTDAFSRSWSNKYCYLFPPFSLISRCVRKMREDCAECLHDDHSTMADTNVVCRTFRTFDRNSTDSSTQKENTVHSSNNQVSSITRSVETGSMPNFRGQFEDQGLSRQTCEILLASWRYSTKKQYGTFIRRWLRFCSEREINSFQPSVKEVLSFLTELYENGLGYSAINTARSALSSYGIQHSGVSIGSNNLVIRFFKGVFNLRPGKPRYCETWDVSKVLTFLRKLSPVKSISHKDLTLKLVMLIALTNAIVILSC